MYLQKVVPWLRRALAMSGKSVGVAPYLPTSMFTRRPVDISGPAVVQDANRAMTATVSNSRVGCLPSESATA